MIEVNNFDKLKAQKREYYWANRERLLQRARDFYALHAEEKKAYAKEWHKTYKIKNREKIRAAGKAYWANNPDKAKFFSKRAAHRRRERLRNTEPCDSASYNILQQLIVSAPRLICGICGKNMAKSDRTIDHIVPLAKGGTGHIANLRVTHMACNLSKHDKSPEQFSGQHEINFGGNGPYPNSHARSGAYPTNQHGSINAMSVSEPEHYIHNNN